MIANNPLFLIPTLTGFIFIIAGFIQYKFPPKSINAFYGYRTNKSMKNQKSWDFAQLYSSKLMMKLGLMLTFMGMIGLIYTPSEAIGAIIAVGLLIATLVTLSLMVENKIKKRN